MFFQTNKQNWMTNYDLSPLVITMTMMMTNFWLDFFAMIFLGLFFVIGFFGLFFSLLLDYITITDEKRKNFVNQKSIDWRWWWCDFLSNPEEEKKCQQNNATGNHNHHQKINKNKTVVEYCVWERKRINKSKQTKKKNQREKKCHSFYEWNH